MIALHFPFQSGCLLFLAFLALALPQYQKEVARVDIFVLFLILTMMLVVGFPQMFASVSSLLQVFNRSGCCIQSSTSSASIGVMRGF